MTDNDLTELRRRVSLIKQDIEGEKRVTRHILRKVTENEAISLDLKKEVGELRTEITLLRAVLPGIISGVVGALLREMQDRKS